MNNEETPNEQEDIFDDPTILINPDSGEITIIRKDERVEEALDEGFVVLDSQKLSHEILKKALTALSVVFLDSRDFIEAISTLAKNDDYDTIDQILEDCGEYEMIEDPGYEYTIKFEDVL